MPPNNREVAVITRAGPFENSKRHVQDIDFFNGNGFINPPARPLDHKENCNENSTPTPTLKVDKSTFYRLDKYEKNIMLVFQFSDEDRDVVNSLRETFQGVRFEVEVHSSVTCDQVISIYKEFFKRDFTEYGALIVVILEPMPWNIIVDIPNNPWYDSKRRIGYKNDIHNFLENEQFIPSLQGKPKILISQIDDLRRFNTDRIHVMDVRQNTYELILPKYSYNFPNGSGQDRCQQLILLCERLRETYVAKCFREIVLDLFQECRSKWPSIYSDKLHYSPLSISSQLQKDIRFFY